MKKFIQWLRERPTVARLEEKLARTEAMLLRERRDWEHMRAAGQAYTDKLLASLEGERKLSHERGAQLMIEQNRNNDLMEQLRALQTELLETVRGIRRRDFPSVLDDGDPVKQLTTAEADRAAVKRANVERAERVRDQ